MTDTTFGELRSILAGGRFNELGIYLEGIDDWRAQRRALGYVLQWAPSKDYDIFLYPYVMRSIRSTAFRNTDYSSMIFHAAWYNQMYLYLRRPEWKYGNGFKSFHLKRWHKRFQKIAKVLTAKWFGFDEDLTLEGRWEIFKTFSDPSRVTKRAYREIELTMQRLFKLTFEGKTKSGKRVRPKAFPKTWIRLLTSLTRNYDDFAKEFQQAFLDDMFKDFFA